MSFTLHNFESNIPAKILRRGQDYFEAGAVTSLEPAGKGEWLAMVEGSADYEVSLRMSGDRVREAECDCPYDGGVCKHVVAVLYALRQQGTSPAPKKQRKKTGKTHFEEVLLKVDADEMRDFIRKMKAEDERFGDRFLLYFADKAPGLDVTGKYRSMIRQIIRRYSNRGFIDYSSTFGLSREMYKVLRDAEDALAGKNYRQAAEVAEVVAEELASVFEGCDDSAGNISEILIRAIAVLRELSQLDTLAPPLRTQMLDFIDAVLQNRHWFDYGDFGYELLSVAESLAVHAYPERFLSLLDKLAKTHTGKYTGFRQEFFLTSKIRFLATVGREAESAQLIAGHMDMDDVRAIAVQRAIDERQFGEAKKLLQEGIELARQRSHPGIVHRWELVLLDIARQEHDLEAERHFAKKFAFDRGVNVEHYQAWKNTYSEQEWPGVIEAYIQATIEGVRKRPRQFAWEDPEQSLFFHLSPVFIQEAQWERLLQFMPADPSLDLLHNIHPYLAHRYPKEMLALYLPALLKQAEQASNRKEYYNLAKNMKKVMQDIDGSHEPVRRMANELIQKYPRRPAMIEELTKGVLGRKG
ncbi:MAG: SWIM zinc finger family protein [Saprospiraceae bacterium]|nr:SWIM zinc finger family protein [Saprospiraceae bacterium]